MSQRAVVTVMGQDRIGIVAGITGALAEAGVNIVDISQSLLQDIFAMILMVELPDNADLPVLHDRLAEVGNRLGVKVVVQHEDIFRFMHRI